MGCLIASTARPAIAAASIGSRAHADHDELVPAQTHHGVRAAGHAAQSLADRGQHRIAHLVPVGVVDDLEVVEVEEHEGDRAVGGLQQLLQAVVEEAAVVQPGQRVPQREFGQFGLRARRHGRTDLLAQVQGILSVLAPGEAAAGDALAPGRERSARRERMIPVLGALIAEPVDRTRDLSAEEDQRVAVAARAGRSAGRRHPASPPRARDVRGEAPPRRAFPARGRRAPRAARSGGGTTPTVCTAPPMRRRAPSDGTTSSTVRSPVMRTAPTSLRPYRGAMIDSRRSRASSCRRSRWICWAAAS